MYLHVVSQKLTPLFKICHLLTLCIWLISIARYVLTFNGKSLTYFVNMYCAHSLCHLVAGLIDQKNCQVQYVFASYHNITEIIISSFGFSSETAGTLPQGSYTFVQRPLFLF